MHMLNINQFERRLIAMEREISPEIGQRLYDIFTDPSSSNVDIVEEFSRLDNQTYNDHLLTCEAWQAAQTIAKDKIAEKFAAEADGGARRMAEAKERFSRLRGCFYEDQGLVANCAGGGNPDRIVSTRNCAGCFAAVHGWIEIADEYDEPTVKANLFNS